MKNDIYDLGNFKMLLDKDDQDISKQIRETGWYEDEKFETEVFQKHVKKNMTLVDLGANIGFYTMLGRSIVGEKGRVLSFEPLQENTNLIMESAKINSYKNITVVQAAVGGSIGKTILHISPDNNSENSILNLDFTYGVGKSPKQVSVDLLTLDSYLEKNSNDTHVDFIKMDIEGSESDAIKGMKKVLNENKSLILMTEFWPSGFYINKSTPCDFLETLDGLGFKILHIDHLENSLYPVTVVEMNKIMEQRSKNPTDDTMKVWGWYSNLLCIKK